ncbi:MAG: hypothetical protein IJB99_10650, partial [Clostridia bacterium]|nr:hypothetical protein [Clostridia bacterium]
VIEGLEEAFDIDIDLTTDGESIAQIKVDSKALDINEFFLQIAMDALVVGDAENEYEQFNYDEIIRFLQALELANNFGVEFRKGLDLYDYMNSEDYVNDMQIIEEIASVEINRLSQLAVEKGLLVISETGEITIQSDISQAIGLVSDYLKAFSAETESIRRLCGMKVFEVIEFDMMSYLDRVPGKLVSIANEITKADLGGAAGSVYFHTTAEGEIKADINFSMEGETIALSANGKDEMVITLSYAAMDEEILNASVVLGEKMTLALKVSAEGENAEVKAEISENAISASIQAEGGDIQFALDMLNETMKLYYDVQSEYDGNTVSVEYANGSFTASATESMFGETIGTYSASCTPEGIIVKGEWEDFLSDKYLLNAAVTPVETGWTAIIDYTTTDIYGTNYKVNAEYIEETGKLAGAASVISNFDNTEMPIEFVYENGEGHITFAQNGLAYDLYFVVKVTETETEAGAVIDLGVNLAEEANPDVVIPALTYHYEAFMNNEGEMNFKMDYLFLEDIIRDENGNLVYTQEIHESFDGSKLIYDAVIGDDQISFTAILTETENEFTVTLDGAVNGEAFTAVLGAEILEETETGLKLRGYAEAKAGSNVITAECPITITAVSDENGQKLAVAAELTASENGAAMKPITVNISIELAENVEIVPASGKILTAEDI